MGAVERIDNYTLLARCLSMFHEKVKIQPLLIVIYVTRTVILWMNDLRVYVLFNSISVISGRCMDDNEMLCAMELRFTVEKISPRVRIEPAGQRLTH